MIDEIEALVTRDDTAEEIPGYDDDNIKMLNIKEVDALKGAWYFYYRFLGALCYYLGDYLSDYKEFRKEDE